MLRPTTLVLALSLLVSAAAGQSFGLLLAACRTDLHAAGKGLVPASGLSAGLFLPFYVNDRLVVRAETGINFFRSSSDSGGGQLHRTEVSLTALSRYYLSKKVSLGIGLQGIKLLQKPQSFVVDQQECTPRDVDLCLLFTAAYRWSDRIETGARYGQGLLAAGDLPVFGRAHRRYVHFTLSYLLRNGHIGFAERRKWHSGMAMTHRY